MITFSQFLTESHDMTFEHTCALIKKDCSRYLHQPQPIFRGINQTSAELDAGHFYSMPTARTPKNSGEDFAFMFNAMIDAAFDIRDIRSQAVFAVGDDDTASMYGHVNFIFPKNDVSFIWSPEIYDSYVDAGRLFRKISALLEKQKITFDADKMRKVLFKKIKERMGAGTSHDFVNSTAPARAALESAVDEMIRGINLEPEFNSSGADFLKELVAALRQTGQEFYIKNRQLATALDGHQEILFYGGSGYYAIPTNLAYTAVNLAGGRASTYSELYEWTRVQILNA